ncbi:hypothetical protein H6P81_002474 [Aristolochia fimbriata]|uniref:Uncharacterized protein n=1 Tax=Aristolochia fimbriata TaxID=158543 RepID=A0AAV7FDP8_ARIFI|nr:hypothetical protein H6P81_002474 [Aristolochia fimbriata]
MELEDDVFFADLSKQISLLIMDDDEEFSPGNCPAVSIQALSHAYRPISMPSAFGQEHTQRREIKGTGVFIPRSSAPRRKNRSRRFASCSNCNYGQQPDKTRGVSHATETMKLPSSYSVTKT